MRLCLQNNIKIYYNPIDNFSGVIVKEDNGVIKVGDKIYKDQGVKHSKNEVGWWKVVEKLYTQEYMKLPEGLKEIHKAEVELEVYLRLSKTRTSGVNKIVLDCNPVRDNWVARHLTDKNDI